MRLKGSFSNLLMSNSLRILAGNLNSQYFYYLGFVVGEQLNNGNKQQRSNSLSCILLEKNPEISYALNICWSSWGKLLCPAAYPWSVRADVLCLFHLSCEVSCNGCSWIAWKGFRAILGLVRARCRFGLLFRRFCLRLRMDNSCSNGYLDGKMKWK